jgi:hypothetical protein
VQEGMKLYEFCMEFLVFLYDHAIAHAQKVQKENITISLMGLYLGKVVLCVLCSLLYLVKIKKDKYLVSPVPT